MDFLLGNYPTFIYHIFWCRLYAMKAAWREDALHQKTQANNTRQSLLNTYSPREGELSWLTPQKY